MTDKSYDILYLSRLIEENNHSAFFYTPSYFRDSESIIFIKPEEVIYAYNADELNNLFEIAEYYKAKGLAGYMFLKYEAAYLMNPCFDNTESASDFLPVAGLCMFDIRNTLRFKSLRIDFSGAEDILQEKDFKIDRFRLNVSRNDFADAIGRIRDYIAEGETYQVNYTVKSRFLFRGCISSLFLKLLYMQSAKYTAFINDNDNYILSLSPELFFERKGRRIICKPMKGTESRGINTAEDNNMLISLKESIKDRAENVMIVDLLRNDLSRMEAYTVRCSSLFDIEKYETLFQMISEIEAFTGKESGLRQIFSSLFPCGSITGAPKISTMRIIQKLEKETRGLYTGALGIVSQERDVFNIPIRTLSINRITGEGEMGIGSGIVWDSNTDKEYKETLLKSKFLSENTGCFRIIETMLVENNKIFLEKEHLKRLKQSSEFFLFYCNISEIKKAIKTNLLQTKRNKKYRIRLVLGKWGNFKIEMSELKTEKKTYRLAVSEIRVSSGNRFLYFKTTERSLYDEEYSKCKDKGFDEVIFFNEGGELTEGSRTNIFLKKGNRWFTPQADCGLLKGVYRQQFISKHKGCKETKLFYDDLVNADKIVLTNSVRKEIVASI